MNALGVVAVTFGYGWLWLHSSEYGIGFFGHVWMALIWFIAAFYCAQISVKFR